MKLKDAMEKAKNSATAAYMVRNHQRKMFPKLLEALVAAQGNGIDDDPDVWGQIADAIEEANEVQI